MALTEAKYQSGFVVEECINCSIPFGVTTHYQNQRRADHALYYCPSGHPQYYPQESDIEKERRKSQMLADQVRMEREQREKAERQLRRVQNGTCPKCNRSFKQLQRHMKTKHAAK